MADPGAPRPELLLRVHVRILAEPLHYTIGEMLDSARRVYATAGVRIELASQGWLELPALGEAVDVGRCAQGFLTEDQEHLFAEREGVPPGEVAVYFVQEIARDMNGCAAHPDGAPGALIAAGATLWTFAHELGHLLGLGHVDDRHRLMTGWGTETFSRSLPVLVAGEISLLRASPLLRPGRPW